MRTASSVKFKFVNNKANKFEPDTDTAVVVPPLNYHPAGAVGFHKYAPLSTFNFLSSQYLYLKLESTVIP